MAKKRIAADIDMCGNSVENVKDITATGTVKADVVDGKSNYVTYGLLSEDGWYRFASSPQLTGKTDAIFSIGHFCSHNMSENYLIAVSISYDGFATISQLSGSKAYNYQIISKVRVVWSTTGYHVDFQISKSSGKENKFFVSQFGGIFDVLKATSAPELTSSDHVTELALVNGMACTDGFTGTVTGDLNGTATKAKQDANGKQIDTTYAKITDLSAYVPGETYASHAQAMSKKTSRLSEDGSAFSGKAVNDGDGNRISETYAHGVSIYDGDGEFVETSNAVENGYLKLQDTGDIQVNQCQDSEGKKTIGFSLAESVEERMGVGRVIAYGVPDASGKIAPEDRDIILQDNHALNVISSDSVYVGGSSVELDTDPQQSVDGMRMSVRLAPDGGLESTSEGLKVSQLSDGFYSAPKLILTTDENASGGTALQIYHPCKGTSGVEFVLMNKSRRMRGGWTSGGYRRTTKDRKRGWTVAMNYRRAAMSYGISHDDLTACVLADPLENCYDITQYVKKYYMYPADTTATTVQTTGIPLANLYFGGWDMTTKRQGQKSFGIAARRLKNGKYEYSQTAVLVVHNLGTKMTFGVG